MSPTNPLKILPSLGFHTLIEKEVKQIHYGELTFNVFLKDGVAILKTMRVTRRRRIKYPLDKGIDKGNSIV